MPMLLSELDSVWEGELTVMPGFGLTSDFSSVKQDVLDSLDDMFADWDWPIRHEWDDMDELIASGEVRLHESPRLSHDCMWSGTCVSDDHRENRTFNERKVAAGCKTAPAKSATDTTANCTSASSNTITSSSSSSSIRCENSSSKPVVVGSASASSSSNGVVNSSILTVAVASNSGSSSSSSSVSNLSNSSACVINSNNVVNSNISNVSVVSGAASAKLQVERTSVPQVQTIQVPSVGGPRRAGVTVQKTVARSLLIKPSQNNPKMPQQLPPTKLTLKSTTSTTTALPLPTVVPVPVPAPLPPPPPTVNRTCLPETPAESEDDPCPLDLPLPSVLLNSLLIDNIKTPQGDLWDDVMAAVEEETAAGLIPETPPPSSKASSDSESCDENSFQAPIIAPSTPSPPQADDDDDDEDVPAASSSASPVSSIVNDDHSYHSSVKMEWQRRLDHLGLQTPSDSEEEIDVVSTFERSSNYSSTSGRSSACSSPGSSSDCSSAPDKHSLKDPQELQLAATKLLSEASRAVSKRLRLKLSTGGKPRGRQPTKRRLSTDLDDLDDSMTRMPKKAKAHGGRLKGKHSRFTDHGDFDSKDKRRLHNNMERMRRVDLRNSFEDLRILVPSLMNKDRAPKVLILQDAANYCTELKIQSKQLSTEVFALKKEQERLRATVSGLRRSLAAYR